MSLNLKYWAKGNRWQVSCINLSLLRSRSTMRIISCQSTLVAVVVLTLTVVSCVESKTTQKPKYQYTKKPVPQITVYNPATTSMPKTHKIVPTVKPVEPHLLPPMEKTTYPSHISPKYYTESPEVPGVGPENYTLDYNECYFNFCECCPPERGPRGPKGDRGLEGKSAIKKNAFDLINSFVFKLDLLLLIQGCQVTEASQEQLVYQDHREWAVQWGLKETRVNLIHT